MDPQNILV
jgi:exonuclease III